MPAALLVPSGCIASAGEEVLLQMATIGQDRGRVASYQCGLDCWTSIQMRLKKDVALVLRE